MKELVFLILVGSVASEAFHQTLLQREPLMEKMLREGEWPHYKKFVEQSRKAKGNSFGILPQTTYEYRSEIVGNITIGTPQQQFTVLLDTTTATLWVPSIYCVSKCDSVHKYNASASTSFVKDGRLWTTPSFGENASGILGQDVITIGGVGEKQLAIPKQTLGMATVIPEQIAEHYPDGILGLGFIALAVDSVIPPVVNGYMQRLLDEMVFTVYLESNRDDLRLNQGLVTYGGVDTQNCGPVIAYQPLTAAALWQYKISGVQLGSYSTKTNYDVISDTVSNVIIGPKSVVDNLAKAAGAQFNAQYGLYTIDCKATIAPLQIKVGANTYSIELKNYLLNRAGPTCFFGIIGSDAAGFGPSWIFGTPFIKEYCHVFDMGHQRIGFAKNK